MPPESSTPPPNRAAGVGAEWVSIRQLADLFGVPPFIVRELLLVPGSSFGYIHRTRLWAMLCAGAEESSERLAEIEARGDRVAARLSRSRNVTVPVLKVVARDGSYCRYCGKRVTRDSRVIEHVIPVSRSGPTTLNNLLVACRSCNYAKGRDYPWERGLVLLPPRGHGNGPQPGPEAWAAILPRELAMARPWEYTP